jgi:uncharacterized protein YcaQ
VDKQRLLNVLRELGCVQIDSINVVERSHYLAFWSRLGNYKKQLLDDLLSRDRKVFEYWAHAASIIPIEYYRYFIPAMKERQKVMRSKAKDLLKEEAGLIDTVLQRIERDGPLSSKDFKSECKVKSKSGWWSWKPAKHALELLFNAGILMVSRRESFQRYYDLTENVLPSNIDTDKPTQRERQRFFLTKTLDAWGLARLRDISQYFYGWSTKTNLGIKALSNVINELEKEDVIASTEIEGCNDQYLMLSKDTRSLKEIVNPAGEAHFVTLISPFDNLTWSKPRTKELFDFKPTLELYLPKKTREFGYYALNILFNNQLVGRLDPKIHRDAKTLEIRALEMQQNFRITEEFLVGLTLALKDFLVFNCAENCQISKNCPAFIRKLDLSLC